MTRRLLALAFVVAPAVVQAQGTAVPDYRPLRFEESWPVARGGAWDDAIKHISLAPGDLAWLSLGGNLRARSEGNRNFQFSTAPNATGDFGTTRALFDADLHIGGTGPYARGFVEWRDAQGYHRTLPGGIRWNEQDRHDWQNAFAEAGWGNRLAVRYGRQDITLGKERLVGISDWTNSRRNFEGLRVRASLGNLAVDAVDARVIVVRPDLPDLPDSTTRFKYLAVGSAGVARPSLSAAPALWQVYGMRLDNVLGSLLRRNTFGARAEWRAPMPAGAVGSLEVESAAQRGQQGTQRIEAWFFASDASVAWRRAPLSPTLLLGFDRGSGDKNPTDGIAGTFTALYASAHSFGGIADVFGRGNTQEMRIGAILEPTSWARLQWISRGFSRLELLDGAYTKQNTVFRAPAGNTSREIGAEHDVELTVRATRHLRLQVGGAAVNPGEYLRTTPGGAVPIRFGYAATTFVF